MSTGVCLSRCLEDRNRDRREITRLRAEVKHLRTAIEQQQEVIDMGNATLAANKENV